MFVVRVWGGQYRQELILNVTLCFVRVWGGQYREELIVNVTVFVVRVRKTEILRGNGAECYCVDSEGLTEGNIERNC